MDKVVTKPYNTISSKTCHCDQYLSLDSHSWDSAPCKGHGHFVGLNTSTSGTSSESSESERLVNTENASSEASDSETYQDAVDDSLQGDPTGGETVIRSRSIRLKKPDPVCHRYHWVEDVVILIFDYTIICLLDM